MGVQKTVAHQVTHVTVRNGLTLAYVVALVNSALALLLSFGIDISQEQQVAIVGFVNAAVMLGARVIHMPERTPDGGTVQVTHIPVLTTEPPEIAEPAPAPTRAV